MRKILTAFAATAAVTTAMIGVAGSAQAVGPCDSGAFCAYVLNNQNPASAHIEWQGLDQNWPPAIDNGENSVYNNGNSGLSVRVYDYPLYVDSHYCVARGHYLNLPDARDEDGDSHEWVGGTSGCF